MNSSTSSLEQIRSVQPRWALQLPVQQQSVLFLAARGPDGVRKHHPCKDVVRAYRAFVLNAATTAAPLPRHHDGDTFMSRALFDTGWMWQDVVATFFEHIDELPHHYLMHLMHGAEILGYKHPDNDVRLRWYAFYLRMVEDLHLQPETEAQMDARLNDIFD